MGIRYSNEEQSIWVKVWADSAKKEYVCGQIIGHSDGLWGVLLTNGEYIDVPENQFRRMDLNMPKVHSLQAAVQ